MRFLANLSKEEGIRIKVGKGEGVTMKNAEYKKPSITEFIDWVLHGNPTIGTLLKTAGWLVLYCFIGVIVILLCLPYHVLSSRKKKG